MKRAAWWTVLTDVAPEDLVFVDETGASIRLTRAYARTPRGQRAVGRVPRNHGTPTTLVVALTPDGLQAPQRLLGAMTTERFTAYVQHVLCPTLRPGQVVAIDNLSAHKSAAVRTALAAVGCLLVYLPPYSPDFSPIELAFSKLKAHLKATAARTQAALDVAIDTAVSTVTARDAHGFFAHCGYPLPQLL